MDLPIAILIDLRVILNIFRCDLALHLTGLCCITANIEKLIPLKKILLHRFPVKEDHRNIFVSCHPDDPGRSCPIHKIDTENITSGVNHYLNDLVLLLLVIVAASYRYDYLHRIALFCFQITFYYICHCIDKRVVRCICHDTNTQHMIGFCVLLSATCQ